MTDIPITFEYKGKYYSGFFTKVPGGASASLFFLTLKDPEPGKKGNYHYGQLFYTDTGWRFANNHDSFQGMREYFGSYVMAYFDGVEGND